MLRHELNTLPFGYLEYVDQVIASLRSYLLISNNTVEFPPR